eukprot:2771547-Pleurochrysis_carterae.AAC.2
MNRCDHQLRTVLRSSPADEGGAHLLNLDLNSELGSPAIHKALQIAHDGAHLDDERRLRLQYLYHQYRIKYSTRVIKYRSRK